MTTDRLKGSWSIGQLNGERFGFRGAHTAYGPGISSSDSRSGSAGTGAATEMNTRATPLFVRRRRIRQTRHDHLHVLPDLALRAWISQQVGRMKGRHHRNRSHLMELATHA